MIWQKILEKGSSILAEAGIEEADVDARELLMYYKKWNWTDLLMNRSQESSPEETEDYLQLIEKRASHTPLQHLTGEQEFMGYLFRVTGDVLVPRQDTEILCEEVIKAAEKKAGKGGAGLKILDMCTGSGCIAISLKKELPYAEVTAADLSDKALSIARQNAEANDAEINFRQGNLFEALNESDTEFDLIVSNPPYIPAEEIETLTPEVKDHDPRMALDGGLDGLDFYRRIAEESYKYMKKDGELFLEIGAPQGEDVKRLLEENSFSDCRVIQDLAQLDRVVTGRNHR